MSEKIFHWTNTFKTLGEADDGGLDIKGSASTNSLDRAGDIIEASAWTKGGLDNYKSNDPIEVVRTGLSGISSTLKTLTI